MYVFILRRYREGDKEGSLKGIGRAETCGVVLTDNEGIPISLMDSYGEEDPMFQALVRRLHGKGETIKTKRTRKPFQAVIKQGQYTYFLEPSKLIIV